MSRWSIRNLVSPISYAQFKKLSEEFRQAAQRSFGTDSVLEIRAMDRTKRTSSFMHDDDVMNAMDAENKQHTFLTTDKLSDVTKAVWNKAAYMEVSVRPAHADKAPPAAWGHAEFGGLEQKQATFYLQPDDDSASADMISGQRFKWVGDGYDSNSYRGVHPTGPIIDSDRLYKWLATHERFVF